MVIIGRAANMILANSPGVFHVGLYAPPEVRVQILCGGSTSSGRKPRSWWRSWSRRT